MRLVGLVLEDITNQGMRLDGLVLESWRTAVRVLLHRNADESWVHCRNTAFIAE